MSVAIFQLLVYPPANGWQRAVIRPRAWPVPNQDLPAWLELYAILHSRLFPDPGRIIAVLQLWRLHVGGGAALLSRNALLWRPQFGAGVWLDQPPPTLWTVEEFLKAVPGAGMRPPIYQAARLAPEDRDILTIWKNIGGRGAWLAFSVMCDPEAFLKTEAPLYRSWIEEPSIAAYDFFIPLVKAVSLSAELFTQRQRHFAPVRNYARESDEDGGLLIVSGSPVQPLLESLVRLEPGIPVAGAAAAFRFEFAGAGNR